MKISTWLKAMSGVFIFLTVLNGISVYSLQKSVGQERTTVKRQAEFKQLGIVYFKVKRNFGCSCQDRI